MGRYLKKTTTSALVALSVISRPRYAYTSVGLDRCCEQWLRFFVPIRAEIDRKGTRVSVRFYSQRRFWWTYAGVL